jgi:hypothetical protein
MMRKAPLLIVVCAAAILGLLGTGCNNDSPPIPKDEFTKPHPMPPAAQQGMRDAMKRAGSKPSTAP